MPSPTFSELPYALRQVAKAAFRTSDSPEKLLTSLSRIHNHVQRISPPQRGKLLAALYPVIHAHLDPSFIPNTETTAESSFRQRTLCAIAAIQLLDAMCEEEPTNLTGLDVVDLWPRLWAWIEFMHNHDYFPQPPKHSSLAEIKVDRFTTMSSYIAIFEGPKDTPDVWAFVLCVWKNFIEFWEGRSSDNLAAASSAYDHKSLRAIFYVSKFVLYCAPQGSLANLIDAAGGDDPVVHLFVRCITLLYTLYKSCPHQVRTFSLLTLGTFMCAVFQKGKPILSPTKLLAAGIVPLLTQIALTLCTSQYAPVVHRDHVASATFLYLSAFYVSYASEEAAAAGVKAGLLQASLLCGAAFPGTSSAIPILYNRLRQLTSEYHVMRALKKALPEVQALVSAGKVGASRHLDLWYGFVRLANERLEVLVDFRSRLRNTRSCANFHCNELISEKEQLHRCGGCRVYYYCSKACQKASWGRQMHRSACSHVERASDGVDKPGNRFRLAVYLHEYRIRKPDLFLKKLAHIHRKKNTDLCVVLDFGPDDVLRHAHVAETGSWGFVLGKHHYGERSATGRHEMHILQFELPHGKTDTKPVLFRCNTSAQLDGLVDIAGRIPAGVDVANLKDRCPALYQEVMELAAMEVVDIYG
ncbi:hypothetical protein R3P38DRAFT_1640039 [Favolaschia claudopus]|uniref:MYND-type domain-containing protein n=1 Tax=Favolaschia claudopus TaxID=2862362 RepID=A0AAW0DMD7_9AGAR